MRKIVLLVVAGVLAAAALRQSLIISDAGVLVFFQRPIAAVLTVVALAAIAVPAGRAIRKAIIRA